MRSAELRRRRDGDEFLKLMLGDRTGSVTAILSDGAGARARLCRAGARSGSAGRFSVHERFGPQLTLESIRPAAEHEYDIASCSTARRARGADGGRSARARWRRSRTRICARCWRRCSARARRPGLSSATRRRPSTTTRPTATACSSTRLTVAQAVSAISATFPGIDRDVAVTGALLHDIGKLDAYEIARRRDRDVRSRAACTARSRSATTACAARSRRSTGSRPSSRRRCCTSSSATTARSSTAARSCRARARRRSCTWSTTSARGWAASTGREGAGGRRAVVGVRQGDRRRARTSPGAVRRRRAAQRRAA